MTIFKNKYVKLFLVAGFIAAVDQVTKLAILKTLPLYDSVLVIPGCFNLTHIQNPGGAFGFMANHSSNLHQVLFLLVSSMALCLIFYFYKNTPATHQFLAMGFALIFGGAVGNLIDRIRFGKVVDFLDFYIGDLHWPAFNIADSAVSVGIVIFLYHLIFNKIPE
ncbi:MAG: signal peptidase II [Deltaproteobacteria bacterium]|nr:signal peptidase II [Deltaproteobacteria bacterium]